MGFRMTSYYFLFVFDQLLQLLLKLSGVHVRALLLLAQKNNENLCQGSPPGRQPYKQYRQPRFRLFRCEGCTLETRMSTVNEILGPRGPALL